MPKIPFIPLILFTLLTNFNAQAEGTEKCENIEAFSSYIMEVYKIDEAAQRLNAFYLQVTDEEKEAMRVLSSLRSQGNITLGDELTNPELKKFGIDVSLYNSINDQPVNALVNGMLQKFSRRLELNPQYTPLRERFNENSGYTAYLTRNQWVLSTAFPVASRVRTGQSYFNNFATKGEPFVIHLEFKEFIDRSPQLSIRVMLAEINGQVTDSNWGSALRGTSYEDFLDEKFNKVCVK